MSANSLAKDGVLDYLGGIKRQETAKTRAETAGSAKPVANDYGARKRNTISSPDKRDRIIRLEAENNTLKEKENILQIEITKMHTKLRRIDGLLRSRSAIGSSSGYDSHDLQRDLQNEFDQLKTQNDISKEKVRKLLVI